MCVDNAGKVDFARLYSFFDNGSNPAQWLLINVGSSAAPSKLTLVGWRGR